MSDARYIYITFGAGTPLRNRYVRTTARPDRADWFVARGLFGERYATTYDQAHWNIGALDAQTLAERHGWTELKLTGAVLTALGGGELPATDETDDTRAVREHMAQDLSTL